MKKRLSLPSIIALDILILVGLIYVLVSIQENTGLPTWSLLHPFGLTIIICQDFLSKFGPEKFENKLIQQTLSLPLKDQVVFWMGFFLLAVSGVIEFYLIKKVSDNQGLGLIFINFAFWAGITKLFGSRELNRIFWTPRKVKNEDSI